MDEKFNALLQDEAFVEKLLAQENDTDVQTLLKENGVEISLEEIAVIRKGIDARLNTEDDELSDDDLENVAGGANVDIPGIITGAVDAICKLGDAVSRWTRRRW